MEVFRAVRMLLACAVALHGCGGGRAWDLRSVGIDQFRVRHVSIFHSRAFVTIESANVSLVETGWPETGVHSQRSWVLSDPPEPDEMASCSCRGLRNVLGTDVDRLARLWILSGPDRHCRPKVTIRSLLSPGTGELEHRFRRPESEQRFHTIMVDPVPAANGDTRAFITLLDQDYLLIYSLFKRSVGKVQFERADQTPLHPISLAELTINHNRLYVADTVSDRLFALPIRHLRQLAFPHDGIRKIVMQANVTYLGRLLGRPRALTLDFHDQLLYILPRDGAIVKWTPGRSLKAENHRVIYQPEQQSANLTQIILGVAGNAWVVSGEYVSHETRRHCVKISV